MKIIKLVKTLVCLVVCLLLSNISNAQYAGGYGGGHVVTDLQAAKTTLYTSPGTYTQTQFHYNGTTVSYADLNFNGNRYLLANIQDPSGGNEFDSLKVSISVLPTVQFNSTARYFVPRNYTIAPVSNGPATITLYYTQADFDTFNSNALYNTKLPFNGTDSLNNKANLRVYRSNGTFETPNLVTMLSPSLSWNNTDSFWALTFTATDSIKGNYFISTPFLSTKLASGISHLCPTPSICQSTATATIQWNAIAGAQDYRLRFRPQGTTTWNVSTIDSVAKTFTNLLFNTPYELQVRVRESANAQGEYSSTYTFTTPTAPNYPTCNAPNAVSYQLLSSSSAKITWNSISNGVNYSIEMKPSAGATWGGTTLADTTYTFQSLSANTNYDYRIRTICSPSNACAVTSNYSSIGTFTTPAAPVVPACATPTNLLATNISATSATIQWTAANNAQLYFVQFKQANAAVWGGGSTANTSRTFNNLTPNTLYNYRIRTTCVAGTTSNAMSDFTSTGTFSTNPLPGNALFNANETPWVLYPNPSSNQVFVSFATNNQSPMLFQLFDVTGRRLTSTELTPLMGNNTFDFSIAGFSTGIYTLKVIQNDAQLFVQRIQKQ